MSSAPTRTFGSYPYWEQQLEMLRVMQLNFIFKNKNWLLACRTSTARGIGYSLWWPIRAYGEASPERGTFFRIPVYEGAQISVAEVHKRVEKSVWVCKRAQKGYRWIYSFKKSRKRSIFVVDSYLKVYLHQLKGMQSSKQGMWKGYHLSIEGIRKKCIFCEKWCIKVIP